MGVSESAWDSKMLECPSIVDTKIKSICSIMETIRGRLALAKQYWSDDRPAFQILHHNVLLTPLRRNEKLAALTDDVRIEDLAKSLKKVKSHVLYLQANSCPAGDQQHK